MLCYSKFLLAIFIACCLLSPLSSAVERDKLISQAKLSSNGSCYTLDRLTLTNSFNFEYLKYYLTHNAFIAASFIVGSSRQSEARQAKRQRFTFFSETCYPEKKYTGRIKEKFCKRKKSHSQYFFKSSQHLAQENRLKVDRCIEGYQNVIFQTHDFQSRSNGESDNASEIEGFDEVYAMAPAAKIEIDALADVIATLSGGQVAKVPIKSKDRAQLKITNDYGGDPTRITDLARNTIIVPQDKIKEVVEMLRAKATIVKISDGALDLLGYSGVNSKIKTKSGLIAEIQVNSPEMIFAKEPPEIAKALLGEDVYDSIASKSPIAGGKGHKLYEKWRSLDEDDPNRRKLEAESKEYYESIRSKTMSIKTGEYLNLKNIYIDYSFESVMFRRDKKTKNIYRKFYGKKEHPAPIPHTNRLFNDALLYGQEITKEEYLKGEGG
ncbi:hypothetical protein ACJJID_05475 [Microbulbifer sp. CnH-101-G]|uniref:hypothetical protein n=1 Tax=Microbulbifer sp. CnH-101-G TaxID=3243393 RepID=UPI004039B84E